MRLDARGCRAEGITLQEAELLAYQSAKELVEEPRQLGPDLGPNLGVGSGVKPSGPAGSDPGTFATLFHVRDVLRHVPQVGALSRPAPGDDQGRPRFRPVAAR
jgi:hypothetical protein